MSTNKKSSSSKGKRYTEAEKKEILSYVEKVNAEKGRGGQSAAAKKFGISQLTIASWLKSASGLPAGVRGSAKGGINGKLSAMLALGTEIERSEKELAKMKVKFNALKESL